MSQILSFKIKENDYDEKTLIQFTKVMGLTNVVEKLTDSSYQIISADKEVFNYSFATDEVILEGWVNDGIYEQFKNLCDKFNSQLLLEGDVVNEICQNDEGLSTFEKVLVILMVVVSFPIIVLALLCSLIILPIRLLWILKRNK